LRRSCLPARPRRSIDTGRRHAGPCQMAHHQLAYRHQGKAQGAFCCGSLLVADGPRSGSGKGQQHLPGEEAWLVGEHRASGEKKYYLANLPAKADPRTLAATIKARWICEQAHQQLKERTRSRSLRGLILAGPASACAYDNDRLRLPSVSPAQNGETGKKNRRPTASANFASRAPSHPRTHRPATKTALPALPKMDLQ
jgi:hypothetical protein